MYKWNDNSREPKQEDLKIYKGNLIRWFRQPHAYTRQPNTAGPTDLKTNNVNEIYLYDSPTDNHIAFKVSFIFRHLESKWGQVGDANVWAPCLSLSFGLCKPNLPCCVALAMQIKQAVDQNLDSPHLRYIYPTQVLCGVPNDSTIVNAFTINPTFGGKGVTGSIASYSHSHTLTSKAVKKGNIVKGYQHRCDDTLHTREAFWMLASIGKESTVPSLLRVGLTVKYQEKTDFLFKMWIDGHIIDKSVGSIQFWGQTPALNVEVPKTPPVGPDHDFKTWEPNMKDHMAEMHYPAVDQVDFVETVDII
jgi:hypothetical protein